MVVVDTLSGESKKISILPVEQVDYKQITKAKFWFNWKEEKNFEVYKLVLDKSEEILGLVSLEVFPDESRIEIRLLANSKDNRGKNKVYTNIAANLIAFACMKSIKFFGEHACISLVPKTNLIQHYMDEYCMLRAGKSLYLDGPELTDLIIKYDRDE